MSYPPSAAKPHWQNVKTSDVKRASQQGALGKGRSHVSGQSSKKHGTFLAINAKVQREYHNFPETKCCIFAILLSFIVLQCILNEGNHSHELRILPEKDKRVIGEAHFRAIGINNCFK